MTEAKKSTQGDESPAEIPEQRAARKARKRLRKLEAEIDAAGPPPENESDEERAERKARKHARREAEAFAVEAEQKLATALKAIEGSAPAKIDSSNVGKRAAILTVAKNEGVYLHEWIAYHRVLGFDEIIFYDHESTDGSTELLAELEAHQLVTPVKWSVAADVSPQIAGYEDGLERLGKDFGWIAFIDLDEFLVLPQHETIGDFLADYDGSEALGINWKNFGSSGHERYEDGLVIDRFRRCSEKAYGRNRRVKTLARSDVVGRPGVHQPKLLKPARYRDITGAQIRDGRSQTINLDLIRLNHYYTKSVEEWTWKAARGRGGKPEALGARKHWYPDFDNRDRNEEEESDIVSRIPAVRDLMEKTPVKTEVSLPPAEHPFPDEAAAQAKAQA